MNTPVVAPKRDGANAVRNDIRNLDKVRSIFASLAKFASAQGIYQSNNPNLINFARAFDQAFRSYFENETELLLTVAQYQLVWREQVVYDIGCNTESIAFLLYKDGVGEITIHNSVTRAELEQFVGILKNALYNPAAGFDTASALWHAEFPNIFYRVLDEQNDGADGDGDGSGNSHREQPLRANDHQDLTAAEDARGPTRHSDTALDTLGAYLNQIVRDEHPGAGAHERELHLQRLLGTQFGIDSQALARWSAATQSGEDTDGLLAFLRIMFDFTRMRSAPPMIRDVTDTIERLVHYLHDEGHIATLIATLELQAGIDPDSLEPAFAAIPERIEQELTDGDYLLALARGARASNTPHDILRYLRLAGEKAVPGLCELLARSTDPSIHEQGCEALIHVAGADILQIIERFDVENPCMAADAAHILTRATLHDIPPVMHRIVSSSDANIRRCAIGYLVHLATDDSARLLCALLKDPSQAVRVKTLAAVDAFCNPLIVEEVTAMCFSDQAASRGPEELEAMFRALGKLAGASALPRLRQMVEKKHYLSMGKSRSKRDKLLAITALRYIAGDESRYLLEKLSHDGDNLVKTKALHVIKKLATPDLPSDEWDRVGTQVPGSKP